MTRTILFAIPTIDGKVNIDLASNLFSVAQMLTLRGIASGVASRTGCSIIQKARSELAASALAMPGVTDLFFIDADMWMPPEDIVRMIEAAEGKHVLSAMYATQGDPPEIRVDSADGDKFEIDDDGCIEVKRIGTGAMIVRRHVLEAMAEKYNRLRFKSYGGRMETAMFDVPLTEEGYTGEDFNFCDDVRELGFKIHALADVTTHHIKTLDLPFNMAQYLKENESKKQ